MNLKSWVSSVLSVQKVLKNQACRVRIFQFSGRNKHVPNISLECVMKTAGLIESMGKGRLKPRKVK